MENDGAKSFSDTVIGKDLSEWVTKYDLKDEKEPALQTILPRVTWLASHPRAGVRTSQHNGQG